MFSYCQPYFPVGLNNAQRSPFTRVMTVVKRYTVEAQVNIFMFTK